MCVRAHMYLAHRQAIERAPSARARVCVCVCRRVSGSIANAQRAFLHPEIHRSAVSHTRARPVVFALPAERRERERRRTVVFVRERIPYSI